MLLIGLSRCQAFPSNLRNFTSVYFRLVHCTWLDLIEKTREYCRIGTIVTLDTGLTLTPTLTLESYWTGLDWTDIGHYHILSRVASRRLLETTGQRAHRQTTDEITEDTRE